MDQPIRRHVKERLVAQNRAFDDHGGDRRDDCGAEQGGIHVADDLFEGEQHGRHRRVECRGQRTGRAHGDEVPNAARRQTQPAADDGGETGANLDRRTLASHRMAGADAQHAGDEFAQRHAAGDHSAGQVVRRFGLRNAAPAHIGKDLGQQESGDEAHERGDGKESKTRRRQAEQPMAGLLDGDREQHRGEARQDADDDRQDQKQLILAQPQLLRAGQRSAHRASAPCFRPMRASAWSSAVAGPQTLNDLTLDTVDQVHPCFDRVLPEDRGRLQLILERPRLTLKRQLLVGRLTAGALFDAHAQTLLRVGEVGDQASPTLGRADASGQRIVGQHQIHDFPNVPDLARLGRRAAQIGSGQHIIAELERCLPGSGEGFAILRSQTENPLELVQCVTVVASLGEQLRHFQTKRRVVGKVRAQREQLRERTASLVVGQQKLDQLEANPASRIGLLAGPRRVERVVIEAERLA